MTRILAVLAAAALAAIFMPVVEAQQRLHCAPRNVVTTALAKKHGERPVLRGVAGRAMIEVWLSESGSFSVIITQAGDGGQVSCMLAAGNSMGHVDEPIMPGEKS
jgi:hypothetical protein